MIVIGVDAHKRSHTCVAVQELTGRRVQLRTASASDDGHGQLLEWARGVGSERVWAIEDCRHVTGRLERFLLGRGERILRVPPRLMAGVRKTAREPGKSDPTDALAIARAALREGLDELPIAQLDEGALEIRQLVDHRDRLVSQRTALINALRWQLHDLDPAFQVPLRGLITPSWQQRTARKLGRLGASVRVRIASDLLKRIRELTTAIQKLYRELAILVSAYRPALLWLPGCGVLCAAKAIGETGGAQRFPTASKYARITGSAPVPASSGQHTRYRLDRGGNRQLNRVLHTIAITQIRTHPPARDYYQRKLAQGKTTREALRCLKRHIATTLWQLLQPDPENTRSRHRRTPHTIICNTPTP
ncbi:MAG: IS110 family transposase [Solirubrobacterales bacterium]|nr:IS110 family transposase [Solirubrobacterales bacterium]